MLFYSVSMFKMNTIIPKEALFKLPLHAKKMRIEYGEGKVAVYRVSCDVKDALRKERCDTFELKELEQYGFSAEVIGRAVEYQKHCERAVREEFLYGDTACTSEEVVFCLKDGRRIGFASINFAIGQLHELVSYIEKETGISPVGTFSRALVQADFTEEEIVIEYYKSQMANLDLNTVELALPKYNTYFTKENIVVFDLQRVVVIPYSALNGIMVFAISSTKSLVEMRRCRYVLRNRKSFSTNINISNGDWAKIAAYMNAHHPNVDADAKLIYTEQDASWI